MSPTARYRRPAERVPPAHCRWCEEPIDPELHPRAQTWHPACVDEYRAQMPGALRSAVAERDGGICAECGRDTAEARPALHRALAAVRGFVYWQRIAAAPGVPRRMSLLDGSGLAAYRLETDEPLRGVLRDLRAAARWEMDHIVPLWRGGPNTLENLQTLCGLCHRAKTSREARERAEEARRAVGQLDLPTTNDVGGRRADAPAPTTPANER